MYHRSMTTRRPLIAANWKMHSVPNEATEQSSVYRPTAKVDTIVFPTFVHLLQCISNGLPVGAQAGHPIDAGAHTGDVSMAMLKELGCTHVLCGHSERRQHHHESNEDVAAQVTAALAHHLTPILCIGETEAERDEGIAETIVYMQLQQLPLEQLTIIAYEPIWAIGTGNTASPEDAETMHAFIRSKLPDATQDTTRILYGGSMKPSNATQLLAQPNIDGGLVGGASLKPEEFKQIVEIASTL